MSTLDINQLTFTQVTGAGALTGIKSSPQLTAPCFFRQDGKLVKADVGQRLVKLPSGKTVVMSEADYDIAFVIA